MAEHKTKISQLETDLQKTKEHKDLIRRSLTLEKELRTEETTKNRRIQKEIENLRDSHKVRNPITLQQISLSMSIFE